MAQTTLIPQSVLDRLVSQDDDNNYSEVLALVKLVNPYAFFSANTIYIYGACIDYDGTYVLWGFSVVGNSRNYMHLTQSEAQALGFIPEEGYTPIKITDLLAK